MTNDVTSVSKKTKDLSFVIPVIAGSWSIFQLALPQLLLLSSDIIRCIHLSFAILLVYLSYPVFKKNSKNRGLNSISWLNILLGTISAVAAMYLAIDYQGIAFRQGMPITRDLVMGIILIVLLLEATRRALGPALPTIACIFIVYSFFSESMPDLIAFKNASLNKVINKLTMGTEGIYGVPLDVSASTVFLFVLFGAMLEKAGGGKFFIDIAFRLLGKYKGGPAKAAVMASGMTGLVSGSSIANTVTTGTFTIPLMKKAGYSGVKAGAIEVAASTNGQLMPPIMGAAAFIIAEYCNLSYFEVVRAAFIPAIVSYITLIYITHLEAGKLGLRGLAKKELPLVEKDCLKSFVYLIPLVFLLYQLIIERRSAQLSAYYAVLLLTWVILLRELYHGRNQKKPIKASLLSAAKIVWDSLVTGGRNMMSIGVAVAAAGIIVGIVTLGLGGVITDVIDLISGGNLVLLLVITAIASLILGMGLPTTANYIVMASITAPVIITLSEDAGLVVPLIAAHLFCFYFGILADDTPPVGLAAYAASAISKEDPIKTGVQGFIYDMRTAILPFMFIFNKDLLLIGITEWWQILLVFITALFAMFAFASLMQNFLLMKNKLYESLILLISAIILLRPDLMMGWLDVSKYLVYLIGVLLFISAFLLQRLRKTV